MRRSLDLSLTSQKKAKETSAFGAFEDCMATHGIPLWNQTLGNLISRKQLRNRGSRSLMGYPLENVWVL